MKYFSLSLLIVASCLAVTLHAGESTHIDVGSNRLPMRAASMNYRFEQTFLMSLIGKAGQGAGGNIVLTLKTEPTENGGYTVSCEATTEKQLVSGVGRPMQSVLWRSLTTMDGMDSVVHEAILEHGTQTKDMTVELRDSAMFGANKVITSREGGTMTRELMIGANEIVTTFFQVAAFVGTLSSLPKEGMRIRWVLNGMPHPMIVTRDAEAPRSFTMSRDNVDGNSEMELLKLRFIFADDSEDFALPKRILFISGNRQLEVVRMEE